MSEGKICASRDQLTAIRDSCRLHTKLPDRGVTIKNKEECCCCSASIRQRCFCPEGIVRLCPHLETKDNSMSSNWVQQREGGVSPKSSMGR